MNLVERLTAAQLPDLVPFKDVAYLDGQESFIVATLIKQASSERGA